jgi:hypothetical protein
MLFLAWARWQQDQRSTHMRGASNETTKGSSTMKSMFKGALGALMVVLALGALTATSALAAGTPTATTGSAGAISSTEESLVGKVNANGATTKYYFEYGTSTSYGSRTTEGSTKGTEIKVGGTAVGLTAKTTYHFRLVATNEFGTSYGEDKTFLATPVLPEFVMSGQYAETTFETTSGSLVLEWSGQKSLTCTSGIFYGYFISSKEIAGTMRWERCFNEHSVCVNETEAVKSELLKGKLGYTNKAKKEVGLILEGKNSEIWANNVRCPGGDAPLMGKLGGTLILPINTKIPAGGQFTFKYTQEKDKQLAGELGGQLFYSEQLFGVSASFTGSANKAFEVQA